MRSVYNFVVEPIGERYNNKKKIGDSELILNTEIYNHQFVNRLAKVISCPIASDDLGIKPGDIVIVHHNVFRRWHNIKGIEKNSKNYFNENTYIINEDQIFLYKSKDKWKCPRGYCFVKPLKNDNSFDLEKEKPLVGVVKYTDGVVEKNDLIGFRPNSEYEFIIDNEKLYRILSKAITIKYEYQGNEKMYNPSWAQSS
jgi:protein involved in sex pheromone biosynthesis